MTLELRSEPAPSLAIDTESATKVQEEALGNPGSQQLHFMKKISAVFDDSNHFKELLHASSLTHPMLEAKTDVSKLHVRNIQDLKRVVTTHLSMSFCDLCLKNRPVFTSEQVLYTKAGLAQHKEKGDDEGPLKEANFKGHPKCRCVWSVLSSELSTVPFHSHTIGALLHIQTAELHRGV